MIQNTSFQDLDTTIHTCPDIATKRSHRNTLLQSLCMILGFALIVGSRSDLITYDKMRLFLLFFGLCTIGITTIYLIHGSKSLLYIPTQSTLKRGVKYYDLISEVYLTDLYKTSAGNNKIGIKENPSGNVRVEYLIDKEKKFLMVAVARFDNLLFIPLCNTTVYTDTEAEQVIGFLKL